MRVQIDDSLLSALNDALNERQTLIDAQAAELIKLHAQVAEFGVTVEELQAMLRERNEDVKRKDALLEEYRGENEALSRYIDREDAKKLGMTPPPHP